MYPTYTNSNRFRIVYVVVWHVLSVVQALYFYLVTGLPVEFAFVDAFVHNYLFALIGIAILPIVNYSKLDAPNVFNTIVTHAAAAALLITVWLTVGSYLISFFYANEPAFLAFEANSNSWRVVQGVVFYFLLVLNYYLLIYYDERRQQAVREAALESRVKEAELSMLKSQLNPHFIFNSLNSLSYLTLTDPPKAQEMVINLANFLRFSLNSPDKLVTLDEELKAINQYLSIEKVRFEERLAIQIHRDEAAAGLKLPSMMLQPLVENAVKYGVYESVKGNRIAVNCQRENGFLTVRVSNDFETVGVPRKGAGVGLNNVKDRLKLIYSQDNLLAIHKTDNEFTVTLHIPQ